MTVAREEVLRPFAIGSVAAMKATRQANGDWSVEFDIDFRVKVDESRDIYVRRTVVVRATEQRGRKKRQ